MIQLSKPLLGVEEHAAVERVLKSGWLAAGPEAESFEAEFAEFVTSSHAVAVSSGTAALHLALLALDIGPGDEVILPSFSFAATGNVVKLVGAEPVFVEIDADSFCIDANHVKAAITPRTAAILVVHLYGLAADMSALRAIADSAGLAVVEDAAQAHGATWDGRPVGAWGDVAAFSFYPTKNMTTGEGGMVTTSSESVAHSVRLLRNQGMERRYVHEVVGFNQRMTEIGAAIGRAQLPKLSAWNRQRIENAAFYTAELSHLRTPVVPDGATHVFHQYTLQVEDRDAVVEQLDLDGIGYGIYYPIPIHLQEPFKDASVPMQRTEEVARRALSIPVRPDLTAEERSTVAAVLRKATS